MAITGALSALLWGLAASSALLIGAAIGWFGKLNKWMVASVMALGSGILVSAIAFELMTKAFASGGFWRSSIGVMAGAGAFTVASLLISLWGGRNRKRSTQPRTESSASAIAVGTAIDAIPESIVIGLSVAKGSSVALATVVAVFLSNIPEALSSSAGMRSAGRGPAYVFGVWGGVAVASSLIALLGYTTIGGISGEWLATVQGIGAGALLAMIADTMIPEAFAETHDAAGLIVALGFVIGFAISHGLV